jgi:hypothetical protein
LEVGDRVPLIFIRGEIEAPERGFSLSAKNPISVHVQH